MARALAACPGCRRHVAVQEPACPFCRRVFAVGELVASHRVDAGLSRHARRFAQLLLGGAAVASCSASPPPSQPVATSAPTAATSARPPIAPSAPPPPPPPPPTSDSVYSRRISIYGDSTIEIGEQITFAASSATILPGTGPLLDEIASVLKTWGQLVVTVEGHAAARECDGVGCDALAKRRAEAVRAALVARGVHASRLEVISYGATRPIADPATLQGRNRNRRVGFRVVGPNGLRVDARRDQPVPQ